MPVPKSCFHRFLDLPFTLRPSDQQFLTLPAPPVCTLFALGDSPPPRNINATELLAYFYVSFYSTVKHFTRWNTKHDPRCRLPRLITDLVAWARVTALCGVTVPVMRVAGATKFYLWPPVEVRLAPLRGAGAGGGDTSISGGHAGGVPAPEFLPCLYQGGQKEFMRNLLII
jgi:hypothetical protein